MCLDTVYKELTKKRTGYKVMVNGKGYVKPIFYGADLPKGKWSKDTRTDPISGSPILSPSKRLEYPAGYHIYLSLRGARKFLDCPDSRETIIKVEFRDVVATGEQMSYGDVAVAREIYIPKRIKDYRHD